MHSAQNLPCQFESYCKQPYSLLQVQILSQLLMVSAVSCILELHFLSRVSSGKGTDVYRAFKTAVTLVSPGRGVAGSQGMLSSPCVRGPCFLLLAKVLHGITSKVLLWPRLQRFSTVSLSSCFIFENDSSKTEIPIQCHIRHGRFSLVERTMA